MVKIDGSKVGFSPPPVPSKYDIIPLHTSDRGTFKACRRQWDWSSPAKQNLVPKARIHGVTMPMWFGTGIHYALERYYHPGLREDPVEVWKSWYNLEWNGGLVHVSELDQYTDRNPELRQDDVYWVDGLKSILPDPDEELFAEHLQLGIGMMEFYKEYAQREDNFAVIMVEHTFSVPILDPNGDILMMPDFRGSTNNPGELKQVHARGRMDCVVQDLESGQFGIIDHKTASTISDDYFRHLDLDEQCTTYLWAAEREAAEHDLEYKNVDFVIYNAIRKNYPKPPTITSKGVPSIDRQKEGTTAYLFEKCIKDSGLTAIYEADEKLQNYYSFLVEMGDKLFIQRDLVHRNKAQKESCGRRLYMEAMDMLSNPSIYPNPRKEFGCLNCRFRAPCVAAESGYDWESMLEDGFEKNYDR